MAGYDPKLLKKVDEKNLIEMAKKVKIKNVDKVSKEQLTRAFLEEVEKLNADGQAIDPKVVETYNKVVTLLGLDKEPDEGEPGAAEGGAPEGGAPTPAPAPTLKPKPAAAPAGTKAAPAPKAPAKKEAPKPKEKPAPKEKAPRYTRGHALADALKTMGKGGKLDDLYTKSNENYVKNGGTDKIVEAKFFATIGLIVLIKLGYATADEEKGTFSIVK